MPENWNNYPAFRAEAGQALTIVERSRGIVSASNELQLSRTMWLDFAMDRLGGKRLMKVFGQKPVADTPQEQYNAFVQWLGTVLADKLGAVVNEKKDSMIRKYEGEPGYEITLRLTPPQDDGNRYITIGIDEVPLD